MCKRQLVEGRYGMKGSYWTHIKPGEGEKGRDVLVVQPTDYRQGRRVNWSGTINADVGGEGEILSVSEPRLTVAAQPCVQSVISNLLSLYWVKKLPFQLVQYLSLLCHFY